MTKVHNNLAQQNMFIKYNKKMIDMKLCKSVKKKETNSLPIICTRCFAIYTCIFIKMICACTV